MWVFVRCVCGLLGLEIGVVQTNFSKVTKFEHYIMSQYATSHHGVFSEFAHAALSIYFYPPPPSHTQVCHPWRCEWSLYGRSSKGHLVFFPSQSLKCKHLSCLDLPNEHLVFQSGLLAVTFFFFQAGVGSEAVLHYEDIHTRMLARTLCCSAQMYRGSGDMEWDRPAGPHTHINTHWHNCKKKIKKYNTCMHTVHSHTHSNICDILRHSLTWPCV